MKGRLAFLIGEPSLKLSAKFRRLDSRYSNKCKLTLTIRYPRRIFSQFIIFLNISGFSIYRFLKLIIKINIYIHIFLVIDNAKYLYIFELITRQL